MSTLAKIAPSQDPPISFAEAFARLQADIRPALKDATNPHFRSKYADLSAVWEAIKEPLRTHGFGVLQIPEFDSGGMWLNTVILHKSGEKMEGRYPLRPTKEDPQGFGSALTYARRYSLSAMLGVVADEDDDGNAASNEAPQSSQAQAIHNSPTMHQDEDTEAGVRNWCAVQKAALSRCETVEAVQDWEESRKDALDRLRRKALPAWSELMRLKEARIGNLNLQ